MNRLLQLFRNDEAATAVEYAVMLALILLAVIAAIANMGLANSSVWSHNAEELQSVNFGAQ